jgi:hypothetical protein
MSSEQPDFYKWIQDLTTRSVADQARALQRYNELMQRMLRGDMNDPQLREESARFAREESTRYASDLTQLSLSYYSALLELGRNYSDRFFDQMLYGRAPNAPAGDSAEASSKPRQVTLELQGAAGQEAAAAFVIENKRNTPAEISFLVSEFVDAAGGSPFRAPLELQPAQISLGPLEEAEVKIRLPLLGEMFLPGHQYLATVVVHGYDELELVLRVRLKPAEAAAQPRPGPARPNAGPETEAPPSNSTLTRGPSAHANPNRQKKPAGSRPRRNRRSTTST